jgi:hypothetical protein
MFGLLLRSIQSYLRDTFGAAVWARVLRAAGQPPEGFEPMLPYDVAVLDRLLQACAVELQRPAEVMLEDVGTFLVADPAHGGLRRLLRFGGANFTDFLQSLEELPDRARLALPGLDLPEIRMMEIAPGTYKLLIGCPAQALFPVVLGTLRAMADDYGALVLIDAEAAPPGGSAAGGVLTVQLLMAEHGSGRRFDLAQVAGARHGR